MRISEKQIMQLMQLSSAYLELLSLLDNTNTCVIQSSDIKKGITKLYNEICDQQSEELKTVE